MKRVRFSPRSSFARTLLLIVTLLFVSLVTTYLVVLNFAILPSLQQFNKVLAYEVRMLMTDKLQLEDGTQLVVPPAFRREIYRELGISLYSNEAAEDAGLRWAQHYKNMIDAASNGCLKIEKLEAMTCVCSEHAIKGRGLIQFGGDALQAREEDDHENPTRLVIVPRSNRVDMDQAD